LAIEKAAETNFTAFPGKKCEYTCMILRMIPLICISKVCCVRDYRVWPPENVRRLTLRMIDWAPVSLFHNYVNVLRGERIFVLHFAIKAIGFFEFSLFMEKKEYLVKCGVPIAKGIEAN